MRQSRMFITYSLHRPINGEREGRVILERMRDALDTLFGNDRWLSELIVFGKMLKSFKIGTQTADNISRAIPAVRSLRHHLHPREAEWVSRSSRLIKTVPFPFFSKT